MNKCFRGSLAVLLSMGMGTEAMAIGGANIGNEVPSARAAGQGYVGVAGVNNDPTAVYSNPAAITRLKGTQFTFGGTFENVRGSYENAAGAETKAKIANVVVPNASFTQSFMEGKLGAGLSVQSPFGLETSWPGNGPMRYVATNSRLRMVEISPVLAFQVHRAFSVGAGPDYARLLSAQLDRHVSVDLINLSMNQAIGTPLTNGAPDAISSLRGEGSAFGYHAGLQLTPNTHHSFGAVYHSRKRIRVNGNVTLTGLSGTAASVFGGANYETSAYTDVNLPENVQLGYAFIPNDRWHLEANAGWFRWSKGQDLRVRFAETNATRLGFLGSGNPAVFNPRDAWSFASGVNYKASDVWQWRGGVWYEPWAQPESTFNPGFLDLTRYGLSSGFGFAVTPNVSLDVAYTAIFMHNRHISNNLDSSTSALSNLGQTPPASDGTYKDFANLVAMNVTYRFGGR